MENEKDAFDELLESHIHVMTIIFDDSHGIPRVDLGDIAPHVAYAVFMTIVETLGEMLVPPEITYNDKIIFAPIIQDEDD